MSSITDTTRFLQAIFGTDYVTQAIFADYVRSTEHMRHTRTLESLDPTLDCYCSIAAFPPAAKTNLKSLALEVRFLVIDDVGTKGPAAEAVEKALGRPTAITRTSSGNHQWAYRLSRPVAVKAWDGFFAGVAAKIGHDRALEAAAAQTLVRLPMGRNTKPENAGFAVQLVELNPDAGLDVDGLLLFAEPIAARSSGFSRGGVIPLKNLGAFVMLVPNDDTVDRHEWGDVMGHRIWALSSGSEPGFEIFDAWSKPHASYDAQATRTYWDSIREVSTSGRELLVAARRVDPDGYDGLMGREAAAAFDDGTELAAEPAGGVEFFVDQEKSSIEVVRHFAGRLRCVGRSDWREFDAGTGRWREWTGEHMLRRVLELVRARKTRALDPEVAKKLASVKFIEGIARAAALHVSVMAKATDFDRVPLLLGVPSGVIDLRPGASRAVRRGRASEMVSKAMWVDPAAAGAACPEWTRFLAEFSRGDPSLAEWLQVRAGYCLTGLMDEYIMPFYHGSGGNGKSVYLNALRSVWGEYGAQIEHRLLFEKTGGYHLAPLAILAGVRLAIVTDVPQAAAWDVHIMKMLTGDDAITANRMHQNPITFKSTAKVDVSGNGEPVVKDMDEGVRRRLKLIPLTSQPAVIDKQLSRKLLDEYGAILSWALMGLDKYWALGGLPASKTVDDATEVYHAMLDPFQRWQDEFLTKDFTLGAKVSTADLFRSWDAFRCVEGRHNVAPTNVSILTRKMSEKGFDFSRTSGYTYLRGYKLTKSDPFGVL